MNIWLRIGLIILLGIGVYCKGKFGQVTTPSDPCYEVNKNLPVNYQLQKEDLIFKPGHNTKGKPIPIDSFVGQHLRVAKRVSDEVTTENINPEPVTENLKDSAALVLSLAKGEEMFAALLKPDSKIVLCSGDPNEKPGAPFCSQPLTVISSHQSTQRAPGDYVLLKIPDGQGKEISLFMSAKSRYILKLP